MEKVWLKTYEKFGIQKDISLPAENTSLVDVFENNFKNTDHEKRFCLWTKL